LVLKEDKMNRGYKKQLNKMTIEELIFFEEKLIGAYNKKKEELDGLYSDIVDIRKIWRNKQNKKENI